MIGARPLRDLGAGDVRSALGELVARYSTRSLQITRNSLERAIRHAEGNDLVGRNVAALVKAPRGRGGRPSKSFTLEQAKALLAVAEGTRWHAYVALSLLAGIRTEEARALRWDHVVTWVDDAGGWQPVTVAGFDAARAGEDRFAIYVWRSERSAGIPRPRSHGGRWRCRSGAWRRCGSTGSFSPGTGCGRGRSGRTTA
jgi:integrase